MEQIRSKSEAHQKHIRSTIQSYNDDDGRWSEVDNLPSRGGIRFSNLNVSIFIEREAQYNHTMNRWSKSEANQNRISLNRFSKLPAAGPAMMNSMEQANGVGEPEANQKQTRSEYNGRWSEVGERSAGPAMMNSMERANGVQAGAKQKLKMKEFVYIPKKNGDDGCAGPASMNGDVGLIRVMTDDCRL
ncbi:hypothetical protein L1887_18664 [Cichorium endivia]|nr:hypothetical protein L1887_18664 [Cichorium endivia]